MAVNIFSKEKQSELYELLHLLTSLKRNYIDDCFNQNGKLNKESITFYQFQMLQLIDYMDGDCILKDLQEKTNISKGALSIMMSKLEYMNLVEKYLKKNQKDKRSINIRLTEKGKKILYSKEQEVSNIVENTMLSKIDKNDNDFISNVVTETVKVLRKIASEGDAK